MIPTRRHLHVSLLALGLVVAVCSGQPETGSEATTPQRQADVVASEAGVDAPDAGASNGAMSNAKVRKSTTPSVPNLPLSPLSTQLVELPSALPERVLDGLGDAIGEVPVAVSLPALGVDRATVVPVGLAENGELEVPGAETVGWYQFGVGVGGGRGSTVLAAHVAYNGRNGVFVDLAQAQVGDDVVVSRDGAELTYRVETITQYGKFDLPIDELFDEGSDERVVLITCGGSFNPSLRSYDDNIIVIATPA